MGFLDRFKERLGQTEKQMVNSAKTIFGLKEMNFMDIWDITD